MTFLQAIILAIIEGITEFLPISSTGHMIIASSIMGIATEEFTKVFTVAVQLGAILAVVVLYYKLFFQTFTFYLRLFIAFIPIAIAGLFLKPYVDHMLGDVLVVGISLFTGGIILLFVDRWFTKPEVEDPSKVSYASAFNIGLFQILALIPGVSRSASTIIGGLSQRLTRKAAAEFAFFLAVPTMFAATAKELWDTHKHHAELFNLRNYELLLVGNVIAFLVALLAIKSFVNFLSKHGFKSFGFYRILIGLTIIALYLMHVPLHTV